MHQHNVITYIKSKHSNLKKHSSSIWATIIHWEFIPKGQMTRKWYDKNSKKWLDDIGEFTLKSKKQRNRMRTAPEYPWMVWKNHTKQLKSGGMGWKSPRWQEEAAKYSLYKLKMSRVLWTRLIFNETSGIRSSLRSGRCLTGATGA